MGATTLAEPKEAKALGLGFFAGVAFLVTAITRVSIALAEQWGESASAEAAALRRADRRWLREKRSTWRAERRELRLTRRGRPRSGEGLDLVAHHTPRDFSTSVVHPNTTGLLDHPATVLGVAELCTREGILLRPLGNGRFTDQLGREWYKDVRMAPSQRLLKELGDFIAVWDAETAGRLGDEPMMNPEDLYRELQLLDKAVRFKRSSG